MDFNFNFKLPSEWVQLFRIVLSIYIAWLILLVPRKPLLNDNLKTRIVFVILLVLLAQTDFISALLLIIIYFFSFQSVLHLEKPINERFESSENNKNIENKITASPKPSKMSVNINLKTDKGFGTDKALNLL
jgi:hypothetical protein